VTETLTCGHPDPALCQALGMHLHGRLYELWMTSPAHRRAWDPTGAVSSLGSPVVRVQRIGDPAPQVQTPAPHPLPCIHEGAVLEWCNTCSGELRHVRDCDLHERCTRGVVGETVRSCATCGDYAPSTPAVDTRPVPAAPWAYPVSVCIPHLDTPEQLELGVALWRLQTIRPYLLVIDTGSDAQTRARIERLRAHDLEVHCLQQYVAPHPSCCVSVALDLAHSLCRTSVLVHTHTDVFPRRRDCLEWMVGQCSVSQPVVGWRMSPRTAGPWSECVSHTLTAIHVPTARRLGLSWSLDGYLNEHPEEAEMRGGWPDTESGMWWSMQRAGLSPHLLGDEVNFARHVTEWFDHSRSYTGVKRGRQHLPAEWSRAERDMAAAYSEARARLAEWTRVVGS
jgi:hypothetical protein